MALVDQFGQPFDLKAIAEPQTARVVALANTTSKASSVV